MGAEHKGRVIENFRDRPFDAGCPSVLTTSPFGDICHIPFFQSKEGFRKFRSAFDQDPMWSAFGVSKQRDEDILVSKVEERLRSIPG